VPELLDRERLEPIMEQLQPEFDVIIVDAAPLGAGVDAFALGVVCGAMLFVVRIDHTDVRMADAKLEILDRLPIRLIGAVLNGVKSGGAFQYYSYYTEYLMTEPTPAKTGAVRKTPTSSRRLTPTKA
jgi:Mrp family chromosome partitioning ATPase